MALSKAHKHLAGVVYLFFSTEEQWGHFNSNPSALSLIPCIVIWTNFWLTTLELFVSEHLNSKGLN